MGDVIYLFGARSPMIEPILISEQRCVSIRFSAAVNATHLLLYCGQEKPVVALHSMEALALNLKKWEWRDLWR